MNRGHLEVAKLLLASPGSASAVNICDTRGASPLLLAVAGGHEALADALLGVEGIRVDAAEKFGCRA